MDKLKKLRQELTQNQLEAIIISQSENRYYFSNFAGTAGMLLITHDAQFLFTDFRYVKQGEEQSPHYQVIKTKTDLISAVTDMINQLKLTKIGFEENYWTWGNFEKLTEKIKNSNIQLLPASNIIGQLRSIKSKEEIAILQKAVDLTDSAFAHLIKIIKVGIEEREVALELEFFMRRAGADGASFQYIVASGTRGAMPHGTASTKKIISGQLVTIDFGCMYQGYCSDMTRNLIFGEPNEQQQHIYDVVLKAQEAALAQIRAGMTGREADKIARDIIASAGYGENFGHGLGHGVGLNIHEAPNLSPNSDVILQEGMVVTVEPGIYLAGWGGVRIEDMVIIKKDKCNRLTKTPKQLYIL